MIKQFMPADQRSVVCFFLVNGLLFGNILPRLPFFKERLALSDAELSIALLFIAMGSIFSFLTASKLIQRFGASRVSFYSAIGANLVLIPLPFVFNLPSFAFLLFLVGVGNGYMDVAMNMKAVAVELRLERRILSKMHGLWSVGTLLGGLICGLMISLNLSLEAHLIGASLMALLFVSVLARDGIGTDIPLAPTNAAKNNQGSVEEKSQTPKMKISWPSFTLISIGLIGFCDAVSESTSMDWSSIYFTGLMPETSSFIVAGFVAFTLTMVIGRFSGDWLINRFTPRNLLLADAGIVFLAYLLIIGPQNPWIAAFGYAMAGAGMGTVAPLVYGLGGRDKSMAPGVALTIVTGIGYTGFLIGAPIIGLLADWIGLRWALCAILAIGAFMSLLAWQLPKDFKGFEKA